MIDLSTFKLAALIVGCLVIGSMGGSYVKGKSMNYAIEAATTEMLQKNLDAIKEVQKADSEQAVRDAARIEELEKEAYDLKTVISHATGLSAADVARVRKYFADSDGAKAGKRTRRR